MIHYLKELIRCGSGVSSKSFFLVAVTIIGCFLLIITGFCLVYEVIATGTIASDIKGFATYVGAIASLFATAGVTKVWSEKYENRDESLSEDEAEEEG